MNRNKRLLQDKDHVVVFRWKLGGNVNSPLSTGSLRKQTGCFGPYSLKIIFLHSIST